VVKHLNFEWKDCSLVEFADLNSADIEILIGCIRFFLKNPTSDSTNVDKEILEVLLAKLLINKNCTL
jgi:hypothetical protein